MERNHWSGNLNKKDNNVKGLKKQNKIKRWNKCYNRLRKNRKNSKKTKKNVKLKKERKLSSN